MFWLGYIYWLCPEMRLPEILPDAFEGLWFAGLLVGDTLLLGYLLAVITALIRYGRHKPVL